jgi:hypothetical protein
MTYEEDLRRKKSQWPFKNLNPRVILMHCRGSQLIVCVNKAETFHLKLVAKLQESIICFFLQVCTQDTTVRKLLLTITLPLE